MNPKTRKKFTVLLVILLIGIIATVVSYIIYIQTQKPIVTKLASEYITLKNDLCVLPSEYWDADSLSQEELSALRQNMTEQMADYCDTESDWFLVNLDYWSGYIQGQADGTSSPCYKIDTEIRTIEVQALYLNYATVGMTVAVRSSSSQDMSLESRTYVSYYSVSLRKENGTWKIINDSYNPVDVEYHHDD